MPSPTDELERVTQWVDPVEFYGVLDPYTGELWPHLTSDWREARKIRDNLGGGTIVVVMTRLGADADGEFVEPYIPAQ